MKLYPKNWREISARVRIRAGNKCELCDRLNHHYYDGNKLCHEAEVEWFLLCKKNPGLVKEPGKIIKIVLTTHHLDFNPSNNEEYNLMALCQRCHNRLDARWRAYNRKKKREAKG